MVLRESIAYSKNLLTGEENRLVKNKLIEVPTKGVFTVQLFDSLTGEKIYEAKSENRISAVYANISYLDGYFYRILDNTTNDDSYKFYNYKGYGPCNVITLTDGDIMEDQYDYWIFGNVIGYADLRQAYSGSNIKRGTVNTVESSRIVNYANGAGTVVNSTTRHWVVDFPTSVANGTFKSIYLTGYGNMESVSGNYFGYPQYNWLYDKKWLKSGVSSASLANHCIATDDTYFYALQIDSTKILCWDKRTWVQQADKTLPVAARSICYDRFMKCFWILHADGSFKKLDSSFQVVQSFAKSAVIDIVEGVNISASRSVWDICVTESSVIYTYYGFGGSPTSYKTALAIYNKDGTFAKIIILHSTDHQRATIFEIPNNKLMVMGTTLNLVINKSDFSIYSNSHSGNNQSQWFYYYDYCRWDFDLNIICRYFSKDYGYIGFSWIVPAGAHTLLPESITKTPTNTMKIQYDITVDYVYPLDMPPH